MKSVEETPVTLSNFERLSLINQFRTLALLDKSDAPTYLRHAKALERGYSGQYEFLENLSPEMSQEDCDFVVDVLDMYDALQTSVTQLGAGAGIADSKVRFLGFDGNNEGRFMGYSRFIVEGGQFDYLDMNKDHNSHMPMVQSYKQMLKKWRALGESHAMPAGDVSAVLGEG